MSDQNNEALAQALIPFTQYFRTDVTVIKKPDGSSARTDAPVTLPRLLKHLNGGPALGLYHIKPGESQTCVGVFDLDAHPPKDENGQPTGEPPVPWHEVTGVGNAMLPVLHRRGLVGHPYRSGGGTGIHIYLFWNMPQDAYSVRELMREVVEEIGYEVANSGGLKDRKIEVFPKQNSVPVDRYGNQTFLPLSGKSCPLDAMLDLECLPREAFIGMPIHKSRPVPFRIKPEKTDYLSTGATEIVTDETLDQLRSALSAIPADDRDVWVAMGHALRRLEGGFDIWLSWSERCTAKYDYDDAIDKWDSFTGDLTGYPAVFKLAYKHGWQEPIEFENLGPAEDGQGAPRGAIVSCQAFRNSYCMDDDDFIEGVLPRAELAMIFGPYGSGKTFLAVCMLMSLARGVPWNGLETEQGAVLYIAAESAKGVKARLNAYVKHFTFDDSDLPFHAMDAAPNLTSAPAVQQLVDDILALGPRDTFKVIAVDTLACVMPGDENSSAVMGALLAACKAIYRATGAMVLLIHHTGKDASRGARGWSGLPGACDAMIEVARDGDRRTAIIGKQKEDEDGGVFGFKLRKIDIGVTKRGKVRSSCVVDYVATWAEDIDETEKREAKDAEDRATVLRLVKGCDKRGEKIPATTQGRFTAHPVLSINPEYPSGLTKARLFVMLESMCAEGKLYRRDVSVDSKKRTVFTSDANLV